VSRRCPRRSTAPWSPTQVRGVWLDSAAVGFLDCLPVLLVVCRQYSTQQSGAARQMLLLAWPATCLCVPAVPCGLVVIPPQPITSLAPPLTLFNPSLAPPCRICWRGLRGVLVVAGDRRGSQAGGLSRAQLTALVWGAVAALCASALAAMLAVIGGCPVEGFKLESVTPTLACF
jgi:hypothetical protein